MTRLIHWLLGLAVVLGFVLPSGPARAQYGYGYGYGSPYPRPVRPTMAGPSIDRPDLYLGVGLFGDAIVNQANSGVDFLTSGAGYNLLLGFRLNPSFALEFGFAEGFHNNVTDAWGNSVDYLALNQLTVDAKLFLPVRGLPWQPFLQGGLGFYMLDDSYSSELASGAGFQLGGGIDFWLNPWWSIGGRILYHGIQFSRFTEPQTGQSNSPFLSTVSLEGNLQVHF